MGLAGGGKLLYSVTVKSLSDLTVILRHKNDSPTVSRVRNDDATKELQQSRGGAITSIVTAVAVSAFRWWMWMDTDKVPVPMFGDTAVIQQQWQQQRQLVFVVPSTTTSTTESYYEYNNDEYEFDE